VSENTRTQERRTIKPWRLTTLAAVIAAGLLSTLSLAACGGGGGASAASPPTTAGAALATVNLAGTRLGEVLVDSRGHTLYLFKRDMGTTSTCTGPCAAAWPPLMVNGEPTAGRGLDASLLGTTARSTGTQVTYNGHPLYLFVQDAKAHETNGQGVTAFGAAWFALSAAGDEVTSSATSSGGGGAVGY